VQFVNLIDLVSRYFRTLAGLVASLTTVVAGVFVGSNRLLLIRRYCYRLLGTVRNRCRGLSDRKDP
jgi:uncharacterized membrane-anchored protein